MSEGGNRNCERKSKDFPISSSFFFPFFLPLPSHFLSLYCLPLTLPLHTPCSVLDTHAYLTVPHLQKQWTYSLAFRVLMKAPILVASLLFPHTSSKLISSRLTSPALCYTIGSTLILQLGRLACVFFFLFFFLSCPPFGARIQLQRHWRVRFRTEGCVGDVAKPPRGLLSLHPSLSPPRAALLMFHSLFYLFPVFSFKLGDV